MFILFLPGGALLYMLYKDGGGVDHYVLERTVVHREILNLKREPVREHRELLDMHIHVQQGYLDRAYF